MQRWATRGVAPWNFDGRSCCRLLEDPMIAAIAPIHHSFDRGYA